MADISTYIEKLQSAVYGEEVRNAIIDALNAINEKNFGMKNKTISFPEGGNVVPENGVALDIGTATSDVIVNVPAGGNQKITAFVTFRKGTATKITVAPYYNFKKNVFDLSDYDSISYVTVSIINGTVSVGKSI